VVPTIGLLVVVFLGFLVWFPMMKVFQYRSSCGCSLRFQVENWGYGATQPGKRASFVAQVSDFFFSHLVLGSLFCCHCGSSSSCHIVTGRLICAVNSGLLRKIGEMLRRRRNSWRLFPI
jgi:hypothetical protein